MTDQTMEEAATPAKAAGGGTKKLLLIGAPVLLVMVLAGGFFAAGGPALLAGGGSGERAAQTAKPVFYELPDMLVNLNSTGRKLSFLKINISLELERETDIATMQAMLPRVIDNFQVYLRELRVEDLQGSEGIYRLREELLRRVNTAVAPTKVKDVLFKEMLVQ